MLKISQSNQVKYFLFYYRRLKWRIPVLLVLSAFLAFFDGIGIALFVPLFQIAETGDSSGSALGSLDFVVDFLNNIGIELTIANIMIFIVVLFSFKAVINYLSKYYLTKIRVDFMRAERTHLIDGICNVSYSGFVNIDHGRVQNVITAEMNKAVWAFTSFFSALQAAVMLIGYMSLAFVTNFQFALLITVAGVLSNVIFRIINKKVEIASLYQSIIGNGLQAKILESVWNYKYLKATDLVSKYRTKLVKLTNDTEDLSMKMGKFNALSYSIREPILMFFICGIIFIEVYYFHVSITSIAFSLMLFMRSLTNLMTMQTNWQAFLMNSGSLHLVGELNAELHNKVETDVQEDIADFNDSLTFDHVTFSYAPNLPNVLNDINLTIKKNQTVAFVGESGSGKTTIVNMLAGLLLPNGGALKVDNVPLTSSKVKSFRKNIGYITQEPVVLNDSVFNNITFFDEKNDKNLKRLNITLEKTALTSMVEGLSQKEDTLLGDNGVLISGGQKQRISIARELYRDCSLLLMDEATSALDTENELIIQSNINDLKGKYTIIIIAHRLSTIRNADVIYLLDNGKIEASGNFEELQKKSPKFKKMVDLQDFS